eukprot:6212525-Pleurochrysis_carterae.AAC.2
MFALKKVSNSEQSIDILEHSSITKSGMECESVGKDNPWARICTAELISDCMPLNCAETSPILHSSHMKHADFVYGKLQYNRNLRAHYPLDVLKVLHSARNEPARL